MEIKYKKNKNQLLSMVLIRKVRKSDKAQLLQLRREFHQCTVMNRAIVSKAVFKLVEFRDYDDAIRKDASKYVRAGKGNGKEIAFVAVENSQVVGYIYGIIKTRQKEVHDTPGYVEHWFVAQSSQGKGIGKLLWCALLKWFKSKKCNCIELKTYVGNKRARAVYRKLGLVEKIVAMGKKL